MCAASRDVTRGGLVAVVFHNAKRSENSTCTRLAVIDVVKGTRVWEKPLADSVQRGLGLTVAISDTAVAAGWPGGSTAYAPSTGALLWDAPTKGCAQEEHLGGRKLLTLAYCKTAAGMRFRVGERNPETGKARWMYQVPKTEGAWLISGSPLVIGLLHSSDALDADQILTVSDEGRTQSIIDIGDDYIAGCGDTGACTNVVVTGETAYLPSDPHAFSTANSVTAFDLRTGKRLHDFKAPKLRMWRPVRADGDAVVVVEDPSGSRPARVLRLGPGAQDTEVLLRLPGDMWLNSTLKGLVTPRGQESVIYEDGRLYLHLNSGYLPGEDDPEPMSLVFSNR
ncbi:PQQ-binding-like beta-propeller repeat protein [Streptomyces sp. NPDC052773]|uniref:outer membrane protein assembly factor BamB family protein n=1 Tax=Streptomyces sp. NPDC052773 TaxID=3365693 RepID=UPI0037CFAD15